VGVDVEAVADDVEVDEAAVEFAGGGEVADEAVVFEHLGVPEAWVVAPAEGKSGVVARGLQVVFRRAVRRGRSASAAARTGDFPSDLLAGSDSWRARDGPS